MGRLHTSGSIIKKKRDASSTQKTTKPCRSAIMFGDELTNAEGKALISRLSNCSMPFICAHGRPTLAPM